jgi:uncharacterized protein
MQRILFWLGLILLINWWLRRQSRAAAARGNARREQAGSAGGMSPGPRQTTRSLAEPMMRCGRCGVYIPRSESLQVGEERFCCAEHAHESAKHVP